MNEADVLTATRFGEALPPPGVMSRHLLARATLRTARSVGDLEQRRELLDLADWVMRASELEYEAVYWQYQCEELGIPTSGWNVLVAHWGAHRVAP